MRCCSPATNYSAPLPTACRVNLPTRWKAASSWREQPCNGCGTSCTFLTTHPKLKHLRAKPSPGLSVMFVPAFTGLGAPWWDPDARGAIYGLTRDTGHRRHSHCSHVVSVLPNQRSAKAMESDGLRPSTIRVDGGMAANNFVMQRLADLLGSQVDRPQITETTALGAAYLAGLQCGVYTGLDDITALWQLDRSFEPTRVNSGATNTTSAGWTPCSAPALRITQGISNVMTAVRRVSTLFAMAKPTGTAKSGHKARWNRY
jgi:hypothetical protein